MTSRVLRVPASSAPPKCSNCKAPALGVYAWQEKVFGHIKDHKAILCATCGLGISDKLRGYETPEGEMAYYKPFSNVRIHIRFDYEKGLQPDRQAVADRIAPRKPTKPAHALVETVEGTLIHTYKRFPRVWCDACEKPVEPDVIKIISTTRSGKQYTRTTSTCHECNRPVHNPIEG